jgi:hypothetical protein
MTQQGESQGAGPGPRPGIRSAAPSAAPGPAGPEENAPSELAGIDPAAVLQAAAELTREHPRTALAGGLVVGFLLGGGLTPRVLASLAIFVGRRYAAEAARAAIEGMVRERIGEAATP